MNKTSSVEVQEDSSSSSRISQYLSAIDSQWPMLKFFSLALYSAWILLMMNGTSTISAAEGFETANVHIVLYLASGIPLSTILLIFGISRKSGRALHC